MVLRVPLRLSAVRTRYHTASALSFWNIKKRQASWIMPRRTRALPALASPCSRRRAPLSSGDLLNRHSAPRLGGQARAVTAPHEPAYQLSRPPIPTIGPIAEPWRGSQSHAAALIVSIIV